MDTSTSRFLDASCAGAPLATTSVPPPRSARGCAAHLRDVEFNWRHLHTWLSTAQDGNGKAFVAGVDESTTDADMADVVEHMANVVKAEIHERDVGGLDVDDLVVIASEHLLNSIPRRWKLEAGGWLDI